MRLDGLFSRSNCLQTHRVASTCVTATKPAMFPWHYCNNYRPNLFETMLGRVGGVRGFANHRVRKLISLCGKAVLFAALGY
jgi:hypothetical protein